MTKGKKLAILVMMVLTISAITITAFASNYKTPAEAAAALTGKTVEAIIADKAESGKSYGTLANDAGKLAEFKTEILSMRKDALAQKVADGTMTQERADEIIAAMEDRQATCDGTGTGGTGRSMGACFGGMTGKGQGGTGRGQGSCGGTCQVK